MNRELLSKAIGAIDDRFIAEARFSVPEEAPGPSERSKHVKKKRIISLAIAAVLVLSLSITAFAVYDSVSTPQAAEKVAREQMEAWRDLGILRQEVVPEGPADKIIEIEERSGGEAWYGRIFPHSFDIHWYFGEDKYGASLNIDTLDGKIKSANFFAAADEDAEAVDEIELTVGPDGQKKTFYYYDNYADLIPDDQTVDDFCSALAAYWGYDGYRLADRGDAVYTEDYASFFAAVDGSTRMLDVPWDMSGANFLAVYFNGDAENTPVYIALMRYPGYVGIDVGISHPVG